MRIDGISAVLVVLIASFAIDRAVAVIEFVLRRVPPLKRHFVQPAPWIHYGLATIVAGGVMATFGNVLLLAAVGFPQANRWVDIVMTTIVLVAGSDRIQGIIGSVGLPKGGASEALPAASQPIQITGTLVLDDASMRRFPQPLA
jgi:hypothetical protein